jgi:DNA polymerase (family 10)
VKPQADHSDAVPTSTHHRLTLGRAWALASAASDAIGSAVAGIRQMAVTGGLRRYEPTVAEVVLLVSADDPQRLPDALARVAPVLERDDEGGCVVLSFDGRRVRVISTVPERFGLALVARTGPPGHVECLRRLAASRGWQVTDNELTGPGGAPVPCPDETSVYGAFGLPVVPPELRDGTDELDLAASGSLPTLICQEDIRGDLHVHTRWSDGHGSVKAMIEAACDRGYEYLAITDHSLGASGANGLDAERLALQGGEIERLRQEYPRMQLLHGAEVDILPDGRLDYPDSVLQRLDIVLASLHEADGLGPGEIVVRYLDAIRHPCVNVVTHPTNRLFGLQPGYSIDLEPLFAASVENGTAVEIDGAPGHVDLDGGSARRAVGRGVTLTIDSDAHRVEHLVPNMRYGVATARRGRVEKRHVLNARPVGELRAFLGAKRGRS